MIDLFTLLEINSDDIFGLPDDYQRMEEAKREGQIIDKEDNMLYINRKNFPSIKLDILRKYFFKVIDLENKLINHVEELAGVEKSTSSEAAIANVYKKAEALRDSIRRSKFFVSNEQLLKAWFKKNSYSIKDERVKLHYLMESDYFPIPIKKIILEKYLETYKYDYYKYNNKFMGLDERGKMREWHLYPGKSINLPYKIIDKVTYREVEKDEEEGYSRLEQHKSYMSRGYQISSNSHYAYVRCIKVEDKKEFLTF